MERSDFAAEMSDPEPRDAAMMVIGLVRRELGVPWDEIAIGSRSLTASFSIGAADAESVRSRRYELLVDFVGRLVVGHEQQVRRRRRLTADTAERTEAVRGWVHAVAEQTARARGLVGS